MAAEQHAIAQGAPERDLSDYRAWRNELPDEDLDLIDFYAAYLVGQYTAQTYALDQMSVVAALATERVPRRFWPEATRRLQLVHGEVVEAVRRKAEQEKAAVRRHRRG